MRNATTERNALFLGVVAIGFVVYISNVLVEMPINDWLTYGAFSYPIAFLVTDLTNRILGASAARKVVAAGFIVGVALSLLFADVRIAIASGSAFLVAQILDVQIFDKLRRQNWWKAPLVSSLLASAVDTALFFSLAFAGTGLPWTTWAMGDYAAKLVMAAALLIPFRAFVAALPTEWQTAKA